MLGEGVDNKKNDHPRPILMTMIEDYDDGDDDDGAPSAWPWAEADIWCLISAHTVKDTSVDHPCSIHVVIITCIANSATSEYCITFTCPSVHVCMSVFHTRYIITFFDNFIGPPVWGDCFKKVVWSDNLQRNLSGALICKQNCPEQQFENKGDKNYSFQISKKINHQNCW